MTQFNHHRRMPARRLLTCALVSCLAIAAAPDVMAQSANASLRGNVASAQAGSEVVATNVATGSVRRSTVRADGTPRVSGTNVEFNGEGAATELRIGCMAGAVKAAVGATFAATVKVWVKRALSLSALSVTVSVTVLLPPAFISTVP